MMVLVISFKFLQEYYICILFSVRIVKKILAAVNKDSLFVLNNPGKQGDSHAVGKVSLFCNLEKNIIYITHNKQNLYVNTIGGNCHSRNYDKGRHKVQRLWIADLSLTSARFHIIIHIIILMFLLTAF